MKGTIVRWRDDRGFGFIHSDEYQGDIFVHISEFEPGVRRPQVGDEVEFRIELNKGKTRAHLVSFVGVEPARGNFALSILPVLVLVGIALGVVSFLTYQAPERAPEDDKLGFECEGKTRCSHMTSCHEAKFYLAHCPNVKIDGDRDGVPCEQQWCGQ